MSESASRPFWGQYESHNLFVGAVPLCVAERRSSQVDSACERLAGVKGPAQPLSEIQR
jgi:hypothetical protein